MGDADPIEAGLLLALRVTGGSAGAVLLRPAAETLASEICSPVIRIERKWSSPLLKTSRTLWIKAHSQIAGGGALVESPVIAFPGYVGESLAGLLCLALPPQGGRSFGLRNLDSVAQLVIEAALVEPPPLSDGLALIKESADPAAALLRLLEQHSFNISAVARKLGCTRKTIYNLADRYGVSLTPIRSR